MTVTNWIVLLALLAPIWTALATLAWIAAKVGDRLVALEAWKADVDRVDSEFTGELRWPIEPDEDFLDGLRDVAGDVDDTRRKQLESIVVMSDRRH